MALIKRYMLPAWPNNPVKHCWLYERIAPKYNYVRSNNPNFLHSVRAQRGATCYITTERLMKSQQQPGHPITETGKGNEHGRNRG